MVMKRSTSFLFHLKLWMVNAKRFGLKMLTITSSKDFLRPLFAGVAKMAFARMNG